MKKPSILLSLLMLVTVLSALAAEKHPRVAELEDKLIEDATKQLKSRFPDIPFILSINIEPLRRAGDREVAGVGDGERLPYLEIDEDEMRNEWDNPKASLYSLLARVVRISSSITVPETLSESEVSDIQDVLNQSMRLIPGRDVIQVRRQNWRYGSGFNPQVVYLVGGIGLLLFLIGLFVVSRMSVRRLASAIGELQSVSGKDNAAGAVAAAPSPTSATPKKEAGTGSRGGELTVNDPVKLREMVQSRMQALIDNGGFPNLRDLMLLDDYAKSSPRSLGAALSALPTEIKKDVFSLAPGPHWFEAFTEPGEMDGKVMEIVEKLSQMRSEGNDKPFERLLIQIWRMGEARVPFIKELGSEEGLILLSYLPKSIAVPTGRAAFPGIWGGLLEHGYQWISFPDDRIKELTEAGLKITPLHDYDELGKYMSDKDLVSYMRFADLDLERDVYEALDDKSLVVQLRPPFYVIFDAKKEHLEGLVARINIENWAIALFNVPRTIRSVIEGLFNSKQLFLYKERMKGFDSTAPDPEEVGLQRENIAQAYRDLLAVTTLAKKEPLAKVEDPVQAPETKTGEAAADGEGDNHEKVA